MYAFFGQDARGLHWLMNAGTVEDTLREYERYSTEHLNIYDAILVVPIVGFADTDGNKPNRAPLETFFLDELSVDKDAL